MNLDLTPLLEAKRAQGGIVPLIVLWLTEKIEWQTQSATPWASMETYRERLEWMK